MIMEYKQTISTELWETWKRLRRVGDSKKIANKVKMTSQTIDNAFKFGYVKQQAVQDAITEFFEERLEKEIEQTKRLKKKEQLLKNI